MKQHALTHKSQDIAAAAAAAAASGRDSSSANNVDPGSAVNRDDSNSSSPRLLEAAVAGAKRSPGDSPVAESMMPLPKRQHGK